MFFASKRIPKIPVCSIPIRSATILPFRSSMSNNPAFNSHASVIASAAGSMYAQQATTAESVSDKEVFVQKMNELAQEIGMYDTIFYNETGLDITNTRSGGYGTVHDMALLYEYVLRKDPKLFDATRRPYAEIFSLDLIQHIAKNTNQSVGSFPGLLGSKTGYTDLAGGNLAVAFDSGLATPIVIVVLGSTVDGRFEDVQTLAQAAREAVAQDSL